MCQLAVQMCKIMRSDKRLTMSEKRDDGLVFEITKPNQTVYARIEASDWIDDGRITLWCMHGMRLREAAVSLKGPCHIDFFKRSEGGFDCFCVSDDEDGRQQQVCKKKTLPHCPSVTYLLKTRMLEIVFVN